MKHKNQTRILSLLLALCLLMGLPAVAASAEDFTTTPMIDGGDSHTLALKSNGTVWAWGNNEYGQLGSSIHMNRSTPVQVSGLSGVTAIAAGGAHSLALKSDRTVWAWGNNEVGQLGNGTYLDRSKPVKVSGLSDVTAIAAGGPHSLALKSDGTVWAWGGNSHGTLGDGTTTDRRKPVQVSGLSGITAVAAGLHSLALKSDGTVWIWGYNRFGQLGDGTTTDRSTPFQVKGLGGVTAISAGAYHSIALKNDGTIWSWGFNDCGQLGDGTTTYNSKTPGQVTGLSGITAIVAGSSFSMVLASDGTVWGWGSNYQYGQLGDGTSTDRSTPVQVAELGSAVAIATGDTYTFAQKADGTVWAWGNHESGQLGNVMIFTPVRTPIQVQGPGGNGWFNVNGTEFTANTIFGTKYESNFWNWFKFIVLFGWLWMWF